MKDLSLDLPRKRLRGWPIYLWRMIRHPLQASREVAEWETVRPGLLVVTVFGLYLAAGSFLSYLNHDYPPPPEEMAVWIRAWGESFMLPLVNVPLEQYRLFMAIISLPVTLGSWVLMAGAARLLALTFGRGASFEQYLNLLAFSFFPFWFLSGLGDSLFSDGLRAYIVPALQNQYGPLLRDLFQAYPVWLYTVLFGLGGVYNGLAAGAAGRLRGWQAAVTGMVTFAIPMFFASTLYR